MVSDARRIVRWGKGEGECLGEGMRKGDMGGGNSGMLTL